MKVWPKRILIVDDKFQRLVGLSDNLARLCPDWELSFMNSSSEALKFLAVHPCEVVICDMHLSSMDGPLFLREVGKRHPRTHRFIMSDPKDKEAMMQCVVGTLQFLPRHCQPEALKAAVDRVIALDRWGGGSEMKSLIGHIRTFPSIPSLYFEVLKEVRSPDVSVDRVASIIAKDMAMSIKILQVLNSAYYATSRQITDLKEAVNLLGLEMVTSLVLCIQIFSQFDQLKPNYFSIDKLWRHSTEVAHLARKIAQYERLKLEKIEESFSAGLLHDIGKLVLANSFEEQCLEAQKLSSAQKMPLWNAEKQIFGVSHGEIGAYLIVNWGLPMSWAEAAAFHHFPLSEERCELGALLSVHAADALVHEKNSNPGDPLVSSLDETYLERLNLAGREQIWRDELM